MLNQVHFGDCRESLRAMAESGVKVQMCVTSPPYFGLRDYGHEGQIGLEETPEQFIAELVEVFRCVREVLADDGTLWLNLGDSYGAGKQLLLIPARVALALQADGWVLRQDIIWHKPNPMPESVTDRCTKAHEYLFLLSKSPRYFIDPLGLKEVAVGAMAGNTKPTKGARAYADGATEHRTAAGLHQWAERQRSARDSFKRDDSKRAEVFPGQSMGTHRPDREESSWDVATRNRRSVWTIPVKPFKGAHFAVFPSALVEPCILAGSRPGDLVLDCFMGSGTTADVAIEHGRDFIGCDINLDYKALQDERIAEARAAIAARQEEIDLAARQIDMFKEPTHA